MPSTLHGGSDSRYFEHEFKNHPQRSLFDLSQLHTFAEYDFGVLRPFYLNETIPGDDFDIDVDALIKAMPMVVPPMHRIRIIFSFYFQRNADVWRRWKLFITKGRSGNYETEIPQLDLSKLEDGIKPSSLANSLGMPIMSAEDCKNTLLFPSAVPFAMYQNIYRMHYMNKNLISTDEDDEERKKWLPDDDDDFQLEDGLVTDINGVDLFELRYRNWRDDYFTGAMPYPMRGDPPTLDLKGVISFQDMRIGLTATDGTFLPAVLYTNKDNYPTSGNFVDFPAGTGVSGLPDTDSVTGQIAFLNKTNEVKSVQLDETFSKTGNFNVFRDLSGAPRGAVALRQRGVANIFGLSSVTVDKLQQLFAINAWQVRNMRTDGDYNSIIRIHFDEDPQFPDFAPVYIGGTVQDLVVTEVLQTGGDTETDPLGRQAGHGISVSRGRIGHFHAKDYGWIMGIMSIVPDSMYTQGVPRMFTRRTYVDHYFPEFANLAPQGILNKELYSSFGTTEGEMKKADEVHGYQEIWSEMKTAQNRVSGPLADPDNEYFKSWTLARMFSSLPTLSESFVTMKDNVRKDSFAVQDGEPLFVVQTATAVRAVRSMPYFVDPVNLKV